MKKKESAGKGTSGYSRPMSPEWRNIPGYEGMYQVDRMGQIRSWRCRGRGNHHRASRPSMLTPYARKPRGAAHRSNRVYVKLTNPQGESREVALINIMVEVWLGGKPEGMVAYHKNGDLTDNCAHNIGFTTPAKLGRMTGARSRRCPVAKVDQAGQTVEVYPSARAAARANHMSYQTVIDRCHGRVKKPFALDGHTYCYEKG